MDRRQFTTMAALLPLAGLFSEAWVNEALAAVDVPDGPTNSNQLSDVRVRRAIAHAIDKKTIVETLLDGKAIVADGLLPNGPMKSKTLDPYAYDPDKARALLKEAGWDSSRVLDCVYYYADQATADLMAALQAYLGDVGIKMQYRLLTGDTATALNAVPADPVNGPSAIKWDLGYGARAALALQEYYNGYRTGLSAHTPGDPKFDALIDAINASADPAKQKAAFQAIQDYENAYEHTVPLYYQQLFTYESNKLNRNGHEYGNEQYNYDWGITDWTIEPDS
ncbi:MAG TPA: ABC transporter substrate-binding protein, partial [Alphaproteobacteria bacterium]|nr:ABC transporter substrate-binding protein [Alphaproteobacteria bacterium]